VQCSIMVNELQSKFSDLGSKNFLTLI